MPPLGVERSANDAVITEPQVHGAAQSAIRVGLANCDLASGKPGAPAALAEPPSGLFGLIRPAKRAPSESRRPVPEPVARIYAELKSRLVPNLEDTIARGKRRAAQHEGDSEPIPWRAAGPRVGVREPSRRRRWFGLSRAA